MSHSVPVGTRVRATSWQIRRRLAILVSGNGPRPTRLADYLGAKLGMSVGLDPVLTQDVDKVLRELQVSSIDVAIPAERVDRALVGGDDWARALDAGSRMVQGGVVRVGFAIGRNGTNQEKSARRSGIRGLIDQLRGSGDLSEFQSARVTGSINGTPHVVDLLNDKFVEKTEVDVDRLNDPDASTEYAGELIRKSLRKNRVYLESAVPAAGGGRVSFSNRFIEHPDDQRS